MASKVYTVGYGNIKLPALQAFLEEHNATLFDIRYSPRSRNPIWNKGNLEATLGDHYQHCRNLGNANYQGGPTELVNPDAGIDAILRSTKPVVLMCVCPSFHDCHRSEVAELLKARGITTEELTPRTLGGNPPVQNQLWSGLI
jgi:uncharacterized protein (DUF488 family)